MALVVKDRVKQTTTTTGTGSIVLNGNVSGFQTFTAALSNGDTTYYGIFEPSTNEYEVGLGTWTESTATLARTTVLESSNSGSAVNLTAQAEVFITQPAEKAVFQDSNGDVDLGGNKILFGNLYSTTGDLPSASTYHGMFAHVHGTGKAYYAHAGNWIELVNEDTSGNVSMGGNLTVTGDLTVNGTTTTVNTTNTVVTDSLIELANGTTGSPSNDAGIVIERGDSNNAFIGYDESADKFTVGTGSFTGASTGNLTITTGTLVANVEGNVTGDVTGNADTATTAGTVTTAAQTNITSLGTLTTLTVDDITINGSTISDAADLTIDVGGQIILDADNTGYVLLKDGGTHFGTFFHSGNDLGVYSAVQDGDLLLSGNDGGVVINALTLDMSDAGTAIFNHDIKLADNGRALFGAGSDLQIFHDGSNSKILDGGTGNLHVLGDSEVYIANVNNTEYKARFITDGAVELYYDAAKKFETTSTGIDVTGTVTADGLTVDDITIDGSTISDAGDLTIDVGGDITLDAGGQNIRLKDDGTEFGQLLQDTNNFVLYSSVSDADMIFKGNDGGVITTALTLDMSDAGTAIFNHDIKLSDSSKAIFGTGSDLQIFHDGSANYIQGNSNLNITTANGSDFSITAVNNGAVTAYYDGSAKIATTSSGVSVTGNVVVSGTVDGIDIAGNINQAVKTTSSPQFANVYIDDKIYHHADADTYISFTTDTVQVYAGNSYAQFSGGMLLLNDGSLAEDYDALSGTTPTINVTSGGAFSLTMSGNTTFTFSGASSGYIQGFVLQLTGNGSTVTYPNTVRWAGGTAPDAPANGETDILVFHTRDGGSNWYGVLASDAAA